MNPKTGSAAANNSKVDGSAIIRFILGYEDYWRLMIILLLAGLLAGVCYFVFATATYESRSLIRVNTYMSGVDVAQGIRNSSNVLQLRGVAGQLNSDYVKLQAARKIGIATAGTTADGLRQSVMPVCRVNILDPSHFQVLVLAFDPKAVREMPKALVEAYEEMRKKMGAEYREKAIARYADEVEQIRQKVAEQLDNKLDFEEQSALASAQIELERLSNIPVDIVRTKHRIKEHEQISKALQDQRDGLDVVGKLSLLTSIESDADDPLAAGRVVRSGANLSSPFTFSSPSTTDKRLIVQPGMIEGLAPWQQLEKEKRAAEEKLRLAKFKFLDDHPEIRQLNEELKRLEAALDIELQVAASAFELEKSRLDEKLKELEAKLPDYHKATKEYDSKRQSYDLLTRSQLAWDKAYEKLSRRIESLDTESENQSLTMEFRGFNNLRDGVPVSPNKMKLLMMGTLLGLGLAGGVPFLLRRFDSSVMDLNEFEGNLGINGIGLVPLSEPEVLQELNRAPTVGATVPNALLENFRLIRSSILLNPGPKGDPKVVMLTSARPGEGKTTISSNVAWAFSSLGDRTLLIDCDLRRGRVHEVIGASNEIGMTHLLTGRASMEECIRKTEAENLWAITRGPVVPGTTELLNSGVFAAMLEELKTKFDRIILDTPPVLGLSETTFLQQHAEGIVLVVRCGVTLRKDVEDAVLSLKKLGGHFYGFVLNGVDFSKRLNHYYYYYYSSSYYDANWEEGEEHPPHKRVKI